MLARHQHPIAAVATAPGRGAVGIVRVSGQSLRAFVGALVGRQLTPREATYVAFRDSSGCVIDKGLAIYFPAPHSYTGEDVLELQAHGNPVLLQLMLNRCLEVGASRDDTSRSPLLPDLRLALPGEFTERAFLNDKIDLAQAEAVADLIDASTEAGVRSAARSLTGEFSAAVDATLARLVQLRMLVESTLDFPEEDIDFLTQGDAQGQLRKLIVSVQEVEQRATQGAILREGIKVVIAGQPNAGKSSLLNALVGAEVAIVTPVAGTTRDKVSQLIQIEGVPLHVIDTAGIRVAVDEVEKIGVERAWAEIEAADVVLFLHDLVAWAAKTRDVLAKDPVAEDAAIRSSLQRKLSQKTPVIDVWNKADVTGAVDMSFTRGGIVISAKTGAGLSQLRQHLLQAVGWRAVPEGVFMARERHLQALRQVNNRLTEAQLQLGAAAPALELLAETLRLAQQQLSEITGAYSSDDLLGEIFSRFCIGK